MEATSISTVALEQIIDRLKNNKNRDSTRRNYYCVWQKFNEIYIKLDAKPDSWEDRLILFVDYLVESKFKSTTVQSYISAIKSVLQDDGVTISENQYLLNSLTRACKFENDCVRTRLPIQRGLLNLILDKTEELFMVKQNQPYLNIMYKALFSTTYFGLLRVSELTSGVHPVKACDVHVGENKNKMLFVLCTSKTHWTDSKPQIVKIQSERLKTATKLQKHEVNSKFKYCPFELLRKYLKYRRKYTSKKEPFFVFSSRDPVKPYNMRTTLRTILAMCRLDANMYGTHSFRIGRSVDLLKLGLDLSMVKYLGRWKSNVVYRYLL